MNLFAFYLGGSAKNARLEQHHVVFAVGKTVEDCYPQIKRNWFGITKGLHIDAYICLDAIDGFRVEIITDKPLNQETELENPAKKLYFVNLGGTKPGDFFEYHKSSFVLAISQIGAISRAKKLLQPNFDFIHLDNVMAVDDCLDVGDLLSNYTINLIPDPVKANYYPEVMVIYKLLN
jgi:hypothetical protein